MNNRQQAQELLYVAQLDILGPIHEPTMIIHECIGGFFPAIMCMINDEEIGNYWDVGERGLIYHQHKSSACREGVEWARTEGVKTNFVKDECLTRETCEDCPNLMDKGRCKLYE